MSLIFPFPFSDAHHPIMGWSLLGCTYPLPSCSELQSKVLRSAPAPNYRCRGRWESAEKTTGSWGWIPSGKWNLVEADLRHWLGWRRWSQQLSNYQHVKLRHQTVTGMPENSQVLARLTLLTSSSHIIHLYIRNVVSTGIWEVFSKLKVT